MADDPLTQAPPPTTTEPSATPASAASPAAATTTTTGASYLQLTQTRVPLEDAGEAFTVADASGRLPIVVLPKQPFRIRNEFVLAGVIAIVIGLVFDLALTVRGGIIGIGVLLVFLGVFQSFIVAVPEGARALLLKSGRYYRTVGAGRHVVPPWIVVSHVVTVREIPFSATGYEVPTRDDVRVDLDVLLTFTIGAPEKFVFAISAPDFDQVCMAACLDAIRSLVRSKASSEMLDLGVDDTAQLRTDIGEVIAPYGAEIQRVVITGIRPPIAFMASREARRLASVQRDEQTDRHALEERLLADRESLERQRIGAQRERIELEAANEALRLQHLQERLAAYPAAAAYDVADARLAVARALAGNTRAMVQVGPGGDVADALIVQTLSDDRAPAPAAGTTEPGRSHGTARSRTRGAS
jgi:regulator of protease activity HflC (stomatin/prohibitin superfamily)